MFSKSMVLLLLLGLAATKQSQLAKKVSNLEQALTSLEETVTAQDEDLTALKATTSTQDGEIATLKEAVAAQNTTIAAQNSKIASQNTTIAAQNSKIAAQNTTIAAQNSKIASLETTRTILTTKLTALESKATRIIKAPTGPLGNDSCLVTCVGSTGAGTTTWNGSPGYLFTDVDISGCSFISTPIITASVEGIGYNHYMTEGVRSASSTRFYVYMLGFVYTSYYSSWGSSKPTTSDATSGKLNVHWHATGYVC